MANKKNRSRSASARSTGRRADRLAWFRDARLGLFCHFGLYAVHGRGEWTMNREGIEPAAYAKLTAAFKPSVDFADQLCDLAVELGAHYVVLTTKHHDGFCLFDSKLTDFTTARTGLGRDLVAEFTEAARSRGLRVGLYFSLNDWSRRPGSVEALEDLRRGGEAGDYARYIDFVHGQLRELMTGYGRIDVLWYDGGWPFDAEGWQSRRMNRMARRLQPGVLINNRNGLAGDFGTPEQHLEPEPDRVFEACFTLNDHWGYHRFDRNWKTARQVVDMLITVARTGGNLLINVGPDARGRVPAASAKILREVGRWAKLHEESLRPGMVRPGLDFHEAYQTRAVTARKGATYLHLTAWPGRRLTLTGLEGRVRGVTLLTTGQTLPFTQRRDRLEIDGLPAKPIDAIATVLRLEHRDRLTSRLTAGSRTPEVEHRQY